MNAPALHPIVAPASPFGPLRCGGCGAAVVVEWWKGKDAIECPSGCTVAQQLPPVAGLVDAAARVPAPRGPEPKSRADRPCERCGVPVLPTGGRRAKICEPCLTPSERRKRIAGREYMRARLGRRAA